MTVPFMRGFPVAVSHVPAREIPDQVGRFAISLEGDGADRRLVMLVRHADGTGLAMSLSDLAMGRFGDLISATYGPAEVAAATGRGSGR